ncbi:hypothetical protein TNCV_2171541 [Trichonephila clavipes]|nr:hypothetical protein TNCV_2171541 [Trichonephila clavipes]
MNGLISTKYIERNSNKIWSNNPKYLPMWSRHKAVTKFRLVTGHDCLLKYLHRIRVAHTPFCTLCDIWDDRDADHIRRCPALKDFPLCDLYRQARDIDFSRQLLLFPTFFSLSLFVFVFTPLWRGGLL